MFSAFFATYAVLSGETAGGPSGKELFNLNNVAIETACLLLSSFTCGLASIGARAHNGLMYYGGMAATCVLGRLPRHRDPRTRRHGRSGRGTDRSAFLSAFFALVGCHGVHVTLGTLWLLTMIAQVFAKGYRADILRRVLCFACSGIRSTSSGSRSSRWSIFWEQPNELDGRVSAAAGPTTLLATSRPAAARSRKGFLAILVGLALAILITAVAFFISGTTLVWGPSIPIALVVLAIAQIGVHLVFFIHITTGPDNVNNILALAFGVLIVMLVIVGSLWIMINLNNNMTPMQMQMG